MSTPARVVIELNPDGTLTMEHYTNGARSRTPLPRGIELSEIKETLFHLQTAINNTAARKADKVAEANAKRARAVYFNTAYNHGEAFADRTVGRPASAVRKSRRDTFDENNGIKATVVTADMF
jgi:hypothetical protein